MISGRGNPVPKWYRRYANLRGWYWGVAKAAVVVAIVVLLGSVGLGAAITFVLAIAVLDAYVKRPIRDGRPLSDVGLGREGWVRHTVGGFVGGALLISVMIGVFAVAGWYTVERVAWDRLGDVLGSALVVFLFVSLLEEIVARGFILRFIEQRAGSWLALFFSSAIFGMLHIGNRNASLLAGVALALEAGVLLGAAYLATRSLWVPIGIHWSWNLFEGPIYGTPVSGMRSDGLLVSRISGPEPWTGGAFGPEAGLVAVIVGTVAGLVLCVVAVRRGNILRPGGLKDDPLLAAFED